jgi:hypothetical protein
MQPILPFWFKQRQAKLEPAGENTYKVIAPNQGDVFVQIRSGENGQWLAAVKMIADGEDLVATEPEFDDPGAAWEAAFELYRRAMVT